MQKKYLLSGLFVALVVLLTGCGAQDTSSDESSIHVGYFPNLTHSQALVGLADGTFQEHVGTDVKIEATTFNAGPEEMEALLAGQIDIGYIGPSPAVNGYIKSEGQALKIISGSTANGVAVVAQPELAKEFAEKGPEALAGKKIASPQQGNTQDIALRTYLAEHNLTDRVEIIPMANADQLTLFSQKELDAAWSPEPWASRLIQEASAEILFTEDTLWPEKEFATTVIIVRTEFLEQQPELVKKWLEAHNEITNWINDNPEEAQTLVNGELEKLTTKKLDDTVLKNAWSRLIVTTDPHEDTITQSAKDAYNLGFLGETEPNLDNLYQLDILNEISN